MFQPLAVLHRPHSLRSAVVPASRAVRLGAAGDEREPGSPLPTEGAVRALQDLYGRGHQGQGQLLAAVYK